MTPHPSSRREPNARSADVTPGEVLAGKFRVERVVGRGGMGVVIEATNVQLDQKVALKLLAGGADDPSVVERFSREARAAARLRSEHVARVYDVGKDTLHGPFIVMEMLEGKTLAEIISTTGRVQMHRAVEYVIDACEGLAEAHARGIVHQDVKPANLFLVTGEDGRPTIKLLDFGIATMRTMEHEADATSSHPSAGTPAYLAPEQLRGSPPVDHRADIWALGCVLYELLAGQRAFRANRFTELVTRILEAPPDPLPDDLQLPLPLLAIVERCLEKDPTKRFASTGELALALLPFARRRAHSSVSRAVAHVKAGGLDPGLEMPSSMPPPPSDALIDRLSSTSLRPPGVPSLASLTAGAMDSAASPPTAAPSSRGRLVALVLFVIIGAAAAVGLSTCLGSRPTAAPTRPAEPSATTAPPPPVPPSAAITPPEASAAAPKTSSNGRPTVSPPSPPRNGSPAPRASAPQKVQPSSPGTPDSDIRRQR